MIYTVTLNPALDYVMHTGALRTDDINRSVSESLTYGGKGINVSVILSRLGIAGKALGFIGGFTGEYLKKMLCEEGICCDFCEIAGNTRINVKIKAETELDINAQGPAVSDAEIESLLAKIDAVCDGDYLVLAGSIPKNLPADIYETILQRLHKKQVRFVIDATGDLLLHTLRYHPFLIKPNHHELGDLFGVQTDQEETVAHYAAKLQEMGAQNVLVSRSKDGAFLLDAQGKRHSAGAPAGKLINSVGSGDSMVAGFLAGFLQNGDYHAALRLGIACGTATAFSERLATADKIHAILQKTESHTKSGLSPE